MIGPWVISAILDVTSAVQRNYQFNCWHVSGFSRDLLLVFRVYMYLINIGRVVSWLGVDHKSWWKRKNHSTFGSTPLLQHICQHSESALIKTELLCKLNSKTKLKYRKSNLDIVPSTHDTSTKSQTCYNNRPFYRYGGHIKLIRFTEYYRMPRGMSTFRLYFRALFGTFFS